MESALSASSVVVAVDVDGVLNPITGTPPSGFDRHDVEVPAEHVPWSPFLRRSPDGALRGAVWAWPAHGVWLTGLWSRADVVWASTWEHAANMVWPVLLGVPVFPVGVSSLECPPKLSMDSASWKAFALLEKYGNDRPLVWIDDHAIPTLSSCRRGPTLVVRTDPVVGLTAAEMARVDEFVAVHGSCAAGDC